MSVAPADLPSRTICARSGLDRMVSRVRPVRAAARCSRSRLEIADRALQRVLVAHRAVAAGELLVLGAGREQVRGHDRDRRADPAIAVDLDDHQLVLAADHRGHAAPRRLVVQARHRGVRGVAARRRAEPQAQRAALALDRVDDRVAVAGRDLADDHHGAVGARPRGGPGKQRGDRGGLQDRTHTQGDSHHTPPPPRDPRWPRSRRRGRGVCDPAVRPRARRRPAAAGRCDASHRRAGRPRRRGSAPRSSGCPARGSARPAPAAARCRP